MSTINEAFAQDHRRLESALESSLAYVRAAEWDAASVALGLFRQGIERHMEAEEQMLFQAVEAGAEIPLTAMLRKGHRDLRVFCDELDDALHAHDSDEYARVAASMRALLALHDDKEETELYPRAQAQLGINAAGAIARLDL